MKDLNNNLVVQVFSVGLSNKHIRYAIIHGDISIMHELVAHTHKFVEAGEIKDHHSTEPDKQNLDKASQRSRSLLA